MDKVLAEAIKLFEKLPESEMTADHLKEILKSGIEKSYGERKNHTKIANRTISK